MSKVTIDDLKRDGLLLKNVVNPTKEMCLEATKQNPDAIIFAPKQNTTMALLAVEKDPKLFRFVKNKTDTVIRKTLELDGLQIQNVEPQTNEYCSIALGQNGFAIKSIKDKKSFHCLEAVKQNGLVISIVPQEMRTPEVQLAAILQNPFAIKAVKDPTDFICIKALEKDLRTFKYIKRPSDRVCMFVCDKSFTGTKKDRNGKEFKIKYHMINFINKPSKKMMLKALEADGHAIKYLKCYHAPELCDTAYNQNPSCKKYIKNRKWLYHKEYPGVSEK